MEIQINDKECYYEFGEKRIYVATVFEAVSNTGWFADSYDGSEMTDYFTGKSFKTKQDAIKHVDETMKDIFKKILCEP